jgi:hypothetical protein
MNGPQIPTSPEAGDTSGDKSPSFSPSAKSASKRSKRTVACSGDILTAGEESPSQKLASASSASPGTADVRESPEVAAEPLTWPAEPPPWWPEGAVYAPDMARRMGIPFTHLEPVGQHELDDDAKIPEFLRRQGVTSLGTHAQPIARGRELNKGFRTDQPSRFVPRILRETGAVTPLATPSQSPVAASSTPAVKVAPIANSICPTCQRRVPAKLSSAERQQAYRKRKREHGKPSSLSRTSEA